MSKEYQELHIVIAALIQKVDELSLENAELKNRLAKYETPKNSNNSSIPPSKDENRPQRRSLREQTGRNPGGQKGREGNTLKMAEVPCTVERHMPDYCNCCGADVSNVPQEFVGKRQVFDIPEIKVHVTEHQVFKKRCKACRHETTGSFPAQAKAPVSYGNNIESLIGYLHTRQYIPFKRMQEFFNHVLHVPISEGGIHYLLGKLVKKAKPAYEMIKNKLALEMGGFIGSDETGMKVGGEKYWAWTWQNNEATFITITDNRAQRSITETFGAGFEKAVLVHDCWKSHFNTQALSHQICMAHLLRDLNYLTERYNHKWSRICKTLFKTALSLKNQMSGTDYFILQPKRSLIEKRLDKLLEYSLPTEHEELISFQKRLVKYRQYLFTFLYHQKVPPDNNASERAIRNIKVKQKVSGQFKSPNGAFIFAVLRSITDTVIKSKQNIICSLNTIANLQTD
ncbi:MAG TPA: IS66 family transposase [Draconibacterium sp.]|nr:IS66 family transposase [Draconibacterium sp.]